ncbi:MAG: hypothetical protein DRN25_00890 [Thermoplasmata archaeon]|nr:MAG: hypothetical protein DRN25_00890 [Thermoplasmata archaeon]
MNTLTPGSICPFTAKVQELNRIVIPKPIAERLKLKKGDLVGGYIWKI